jgi:hypothetical protein
MSKLTVLIALTAAMAIISGCIRAENIRLIRNDDGSRFVYTGQAWYFITADGDYVIRLPRKPAGVE